MAWSIFFAAGPVDIGSTDNLQRRIEEHRRGSNHTTRRFGKQIEIMASRELPSIVQARKLERVLKAKKIHGWQSWR